MPQKPYLSNSYTSFRKFKWPYVFFVEYTDMFLNNIFFTELPTARCAPETVPDTSQLTIFSETCYKFSVGKGSSFTGARSSCKKEKGDLIHNMNSAQTSFLISQLDRRKSNLTTQLVWIGAQKEPGVISRTWKWVNGK